MAQQALAIKYRPQTFDDLTEQASIKTILLQQIKTGTFVHAYLLCGGAGTGKTTSARIFAKEINGGLGNPIEMDAASNNSVEDVRAIIQQAKTKSMDSEFKVFIIDECHVLSGTAWQAFLKIIEEPPAKSIFIFCTTDPQKIPKTILSRVQRYDFQRISYDGIVNRLVNIINLENEEIPTSLQKPTTEIYRVEQYSMDGELLNKFDSFKKVEEYFNSNAYDMESIRQCCRGKCKSSHGYKWKQVWKYQRITYDDSALSYIAKLADGGMRDAITLLDKCLAYSTDLSIENVTQALGITGYDNMFNLLASIQQRCGQSIIENIEAVHMSGIDLKQYMKQFTNFVLDVCKYQVTGTFDYIQIPNTYENKLAQIKESVNDVLDILVKLNTEIKWDTSPKATIESTLLLKVFDEHN